MKIELNQISVRDVLKGYKDSNEDGVTAYDGKLNIRPQYQREFIYKDKQRNAVITTIMKGFPLNVMYWIINNYGRYEVLDGQQRTISIGQYINGDYSLDEKFFHNLTTVEQNKILDYKLMIYFCEGTEREKLDWFEIINTYGEKLTPQEIRNAIYMGSWLSDAKIKFSKTNCVAYGLANSGNRPLLTGSPIRQEYLETVLSWISDDKIEYYMGKHQHDKNADELWLYFQNVIQWVRKTFPNYRREMKIVPWGELYNCCTNKELDPNILENEILRLMDNEDVTNKSGIYSYLIKNDEKFLSIRTFPNSIKREIYERQNHRCPFCDANKEYEISDMEADHITPWHEGGTTTKDNCQMLCKKHNRDKSGK